MRTRKVTWWMAGGVTWSRLDNMTIGKGQAERVRSHLLIEVMRDWTWGRRRRRRERGRKREGAVEVW